jgi:UPF0755 protein
VIRKLLPVLGFLARGVLAVAVLYVLYVAGTTAYHTFTDGFSGATTGPAPVVTPGEGSGDLTAAELAYISTYLTLHANDLQQPVGTDTTPVKFTVRPGDTAKVIAKRLFDADLIGDETLFYYYVRYYGLDTQIEAGDFMLNQAMTVPDIANELGRALSNDVKLLVREGLRAEEVATIFSTTTDIKVPYDKFMQAVAPGVDITKYKVPNLYGQLPSGSSLEGFLFPDTYLVTKDTTAAEIVERMLVNFDRKVTSDMRAKYSQHGLTLYQAVTLASIVEREAVIPEERPIIASVYYNRLGIGMKLDADPTVQYALGYQADTGEWWKRPLLVDDLQFDSPYNTYLYADLPPGPIASPGLGSLQAVADPVETNYLYFRATCDGSGHHNFAETFEQHQANACP